MKLRAYLRYLRKIKLWVAFLTVFLVIQVPGEWIRMGENMLDYRLGVFLYVLLAGTGALTVLGEAKRINEISERFINLYPFILFWLVTIKVISPFFSSCHACVRWNFHEVLWDNWRQFGLCSFWMLSEGMEHWMVSKELKKLNLWVEAAACRGQI